MLFTRTGDHPGQKTRTPKYKSKYKKSKTSSKKDQKPQLIRALLDSGSNGDLLFHKKGTPKYFPYSARQVPETWCTLYGDFYTEGRGEIGIKFFEYSNSKEAYICPNIVEYDEEKLNKPVFDLIIGVETMKELGIVLNFNTQDIT
jgi:hypothetical protein